LNADQGTGDWGISIKPAMLEDLYLTAVLAKHRVAEGPGAAAEGARRRLIPSLRRWGGRHLEGVTVTGSYAKGTAIRGASLAPADADVDLFLGLRPEAQDTLASYQDSLAQALREHRPMMGNVSVKVLADNVRVDLTIGRRAPASGDHFLWQRRRGTWVRTNVNEQIRYVRESGCLDAIRLLKIWRRGQGLYFPSFCLELAVIEALGEIGGGAGISVQFLRALEWVAEELPGAALRDPGNASNVVSELMTEEKKWRVAHSARASLRAEGWEELV
jgi:hypothetical protein